MIKIEYDECKYFWDKKNRCNGGVAFLTRQEMVYYVSKKCGVVGRKHLELSQHAARYIKETNQTGI